MADFSVDWFSANIPHWEKVLSVYKDKHNLRFLEIGCFEGRATLWLLENILTGLNSKITVIDTFSGSWEHKNMRNIGTLKEQFMANIEPYKNKVDILQGKSQDFFPSADKNYFDFIYVDGSHNAIDVLRDGMASWDMLKRGGILIFDDFNWGEELAPELRPFNAIKGLLITLGGLCSYQQFNDQIVVWKK
ncbi:MAG TPA: class I SAM-dependent methyltransferase [Clostridia bacterium]